jgi:hypothetical protein
MKKTLVLSLAAALLATAPLSHAQFGNLLGGAKSGSASSGADLSGQQDLLTRSYVAAGKEVVTANGHLLSALGINAESVNAAATADSLSAKDIEAQDKAVSAGAAAVSEALKSGASLKDGEAKTRYAQGLLHLAVGLKKYTDMRKDVQGFSSSVSSASPLQLPGLQSGIYVAKSLPSNVSNLGTVLKSAVDFARSNGVEVPKDATSLI